MNSPRPTDAKQVMPGDKVVLMVGSYDPAHIDYLRAIEALSARSGVSQVWACPLAGDGDRTHVTSMCTILAHDATAATGRQIGCCTVGPDKGFFSPDEVRTWLQRTHPDVVFQLARMDGNWTCEDIAVSFSGRFDGNKAADHVRIANFLPQPDDLVGMIRSGRDMSRSFTQSVWEYVQKNRLYRD